MKQIAFIAGAGGEVVRYDPAVHSVKEAVAPLSKAQRATIFFKALRMANEFLHHIGFTTVADVGHSGFCIEMGGFILEMRVMDSPKMAYVTSYANYTYDPKKINAKVTNIATGADGTDYVIRITGSHSKIGTLPPTIVSVRKDSPDVLKEAFRGILLTAQDLIAVDPKLLSKIKSIMAKQDADLEFNRILSEFDKGEGRQLGSD